MKPNPADYDERACRDAPTEVFFPAGEDISGARQVIRTYCAKCPVMDICLEWVLDVEGATGHSGRAGIYGGKTPRARWAIYDQRNGGNSRPLPPIAHGTDGGHKTHVRRGEVPCGACVEAHRSACARRKGRAA